MFKDVLETVMKKDFRCVVARWLDSLTDNDQQMIAVAFNEHGIYVTYKACRNYGYQGSESAFYRHGKGECPCSNMRSN